MTSVVDTCSRVKVSPPMHGPPLHGHKLLEEDELLLEELEELELLLDEDELLL